MLRASIRTTQFAATKLWQFVNSQIYFGRRLSKKLWPLESQFINDAWRIKFWETKIQEGDSEERVTIFDATHLEKKKKLCFFECATYIVPIINHQLFNQQTYRAIIRVLDCTKEIIRKYILWHKFLFQWKAILICNPQSHICARIGNL